VSEHGGVGDTARSLVIIPTYNEALTIQETVQRLLLTVPAAHVLIVDDGSPDGTGDIAASLAESDPRIHVLHRDRKQGLGAAYVAGFTWALARGYDAVAEMDADGSHQPEELPRLLEGLHDADLVLGSRYVSGGSVVNWPKRREILSKVGNVYARIMLGIQVHDSTGGFRAFRAGTLRAVELSSVASQGYCFQIDMTWRVIRAGLRVKEVPITFVERQQGESKMGAVIVREALTRVTLWGIEHRARQLRGAVAAKMRGRGT
jgi:dolichol-phosphate mannosyltransferase